MKFPEETYKKFIDFVKEVKSETNYIKYRKEYNVDQFHKISAKHYPLVNTHCIETCTIEEFIEEIHSDGPIDDCVMKDEYDYIMEIYETPIKTEGHKYLITLKINGHKVQLLLDEDTGKFELLDDRDVRYFRVDGKKIYLTKTKWVTSTTISAYDIQNITYKDNCIYINKVIMSRVYSVCDDYKPIVTHIIKMDLYSDYNSTYKVEDLIVKTKLLDKSFSITPVIEHCQIQRDVQDRSEDGDLYDIATFSVSADEKPHISSLNELSDFKMNDRNYYIKSDVRFQVRTNNINKTIYDLLNTTDKQLIHIGNAVIQFESKIIAMKKIN